MRRILINSKSENLFIDEGLSIPLSVPFNLGAILFSFTKNQFRPIWITTTLLDASKKTIYNKKRIILNLEFIISNGIIPNYTVEDFTKQLNETLLFKKLNIGKFSQLDEDSEILTKDLKPNFLPLYKTKRSPSHVLFFLTGNSYLFEYSQIKNLTLKDKFDAVEHGLMENNSSAVIQFNSLFKIQKSNGLAKNLFPKLSVNKPNYFLDLFSSSNQQIISSAVERAKHYRSNSIEIKLFEEFGKEVKKLNLSFSFVYEDLNKYSHFLCRIENLNQYADREKELSKKIFLLGAYEKIIREISKNESDLILKIDRIITQAFDLKCILFWDCNNGYLLDYKKAKPLSSTVSPKAFVEKYFSNFDSPSIKIKQLPREELDLPLLGIEFKGVKQVLGVPVFESNEHIGTILYFSSNMKFDIDLINPLESITHFLWSELKKQPILS